MSEENQQQSMPEQPAVPEVVPPIPQQPPVAKPKNTGDWKGRHRGLENLPIEMKEEMENQMRLTNPNSAKKYMAAKYGEQFPILKEMSKMAFYQYWKRHNVQYAKALELQKQVSAVTPEILGVIDAIADENVSLTDKKAALTALFNASEARLKLMLTRQTNFMDPYLEKLILDNRKEQHALLKTISTLSDQLSKDSEKDWLGEAANLVSVILAAVYNAYRLEHTDQSHFSDFAGKVDVSITDYLKAYPTFRENLTKNNKKETK